MLYLLDSDHMTVWERGGPPKIRLKERLDKIAPDDYGTTIINFEEQTRGWLAEIGRAAQKPDIEPELYRRLGDLLRYYQVFSVWQYDDRAATIYQSLVKQKVRVGTKDLKIASIALANGATVLTRNTRDFSKVPGLLVEDWTV